MKSVSEEVNSKNLVKFLSDIQKIVDTSGVPVDYIYVDYCEDYISIRYRREFTEAERRDNEQYLKNMEAYEYANYLELKERFEK